MADLKISQLTALTAVDAATTDVLPVVDTSATTTKKISLSELAEYISTATVITNLIPATSDDLTEGSTNLYYTTAREALKANLASPTFTGTPAAPTAAVDTNTTQIATTGYVVGQGYAKLASPTFTGTPEAPTAAVSTSTTQVATTAFVMNAKEDDQFILASAIF